MFIPPWLMFITEPVEGGGDVESVELEEPEDDEVVEGEDALGDPGKRALDATKAKLRTERAKRIELEEKLRTATTPKEGEPTIDQIRADAETAANKRANARIVRAEVKAAASNILVDPEDAFAFIDLSTFDVDDDGEIDADDISSALTDLIAKRPYLAINAPQGGKKRVPAVPADPAHKPSAPVSHADKVKAARASGDFQAVIALENDLLYQQ